MKERHIRLLKLLSLFGNILVMTLLHLKYVLLHSGISNVFLYLLINADIELERTLPKVSYF